jgi:hypothetical protein
VHVSPSPDVLILVWFAKLGTPGHAQPEFSVSAQNDVAINCTGRAVRHMDHQPSQMLEQQRFVRPYGAQADSVRLLVVGHAAAAVAAEYDYHQHVIISLVLLLVPLMQLLSNQSRVYRSHWHCRSSSPVL